MPAPIVFRLPTWILTVTPYTLDPISGVRTAGIPFPAQMYPPVRTSDNQGASDGYLVYPKDVDALHDPSDYNLVGTDAVTFPWNGKTWSYNVIQVLPRWAGFPNEHLLALLDRMTAEAALTPHLPVPAVPLIPPGTPDCGMGTIAVSATPVLVGTSVDVTVTVRDADGTGVPGVSVTVYHWPFSLPSMVSYTLGRTLTTDGSGQAVFAVVDLAAETITVAAYIGGRECWLGQVSIEWIDVDPDEYTFTVNTPLQIAVNVSATYQPRRSSAVIPLRLALSVSSSYDPSGEEEASAIIPLRIGADVGFTYEPAAPEFTPVSIQNGTASWTDGTCDACNSLNSTSWPLNEITPHVDYETDPIDVECSGGTIQYTIAVTLSGTTITATMTNETASDVLGTWVGTTVGWDGSSSIALAYVSTGADTACVVDTGFMDLHFS